MKISRQELEYLIEQEINEIFGFGDSPAKEYPADAMVEITMTIFSLAQKAGVQTSPDERDTIVNEIERLLKDEGWRIHEQNLVLGDELFLEIDNAPKLHALIYDIEAKLPGALNTIQDAFLRGGIQTDLPSSSPSKEEPEDEEDLTDTEVDLPPVDVPEEEPDEEDLTDTEVDLPPVDVPEEEPEEEVWDPDDPEIAGGAMDDEDFAIVPPDSSRGDGWEEFARVGEIVRVHPDVKKKKIKPEFGGTTSFFSSTPLLGPGDYKVEKVWADERDLVDRKTGEKITLNVADIVDNPDVIEVLPFVEGDVLRTASELNPDFDLFKPDTEYEIVSIGPNEYEPGQPVVVLAARDDEGKIDDDERRLQLSPRDVVDNPDIFEINPPKTISYREHRSLNRMKVLAGIK